LRSPKNWRFFRARPARNTVTVWHEIVLLPGQQYTISLDTLHWFQA
jgi:D-lyxose ketol-isomerase